VASVASSQRFTAIVASPGTAINASHHVHQLLGLRVGRSRIASRVEASARLLRRRRARALLVAGTGACSPPFVWLVGNGMPQPPQ
jgi:hypothetical protein